MTRTTMFYFGRLWRKGGVRDAFKVGMIAALMAVARISTAHVGLIALGAMAFCPALQAAERRRVVLAAALWFSAAYAWLLFYNYIRSGEPFVSSLTGNELGRFDPSYWRVSLLGTFFSPDKGLLAVCPLLLLFPTAALRYRRELAPEMLLTAAVFLISLVRIGAMQQWHSGGGWGNRYYVYLFPSLVLPIMLLSCDAPRPALKAAMAVLWGLGAVINLSGMMTNWFYRQSLVSGSVVPGLAAVWGQSADAVAAMARNVARLLGFPVAPDVVPGASAQNVAASNLINVWWLNLRFIGVPFLACVSLGAAMAGGAALAAYRVLQRAGRSAGRLS